ncbi:MAG: helix-turn-helix domain-containing protein [Candidatus Methanoplasma sp.]|jgi:transcriptional regulator with XRE-family HTH domain|nr:helix-turn-helix domain-containing protein [Candidatus Methanoplasma sp.]
MEMYADLYFHSDPELMMRIGEKIKTVRLNSNITREELQSITGIHKKTIGDAETGKNVTMMTLLAILRGLSMLDQLNELLREEGVSPVMMAGMGL